MSEVELSEIEMRALEESLKWDVSDPVELMRSAGVKVFDFFEFGDWRGMDFTKSDLSKVSFRGADMRGALVTDDQLKQVKKTLPLYAPEVYRPKENGIQAVIGCTASWTEELAASDPDGTSYAFGDLSLIHI